MTHLHFLFTSFLQDVTEVFVQHGLVPSGTEAEANFRQALVIAKRQKPRALELRAAVSLCRLLHTRGLPKDGLRILASAYSWFKEGGATADLTDARELLSREQ